MNHDKKYKSALIINNGVTQPSKINENALASIIKKKQYSVDEYVEGILKGDRVILSQAITLIESILLEHENLAQKVIERCLPHAGNSIRIGITGVPGVGKSSFIETMGVKLTSSDHKIAVLAIDPSSQKSKGSILGDKTRMEHLASDKNSFIRPSPSAGTLGGVARKTRETIILCEAAGFDTIFVETVGVGQSETAVHSMVDFFLLLMLAGAGDELQGIKRGIMEMADIIAITKADGINKTRAEQARTDYANALHLFPASESGWIPEVLVCSAHTDGGINEIWNSVLKYRALTTESGYFMKKRREQSQYWMYEAIRQNLKDNFYHNPEISKLVAEYETEVLDDKISSFAAAKLLLQKYYSLKPKLNIYSLFL